LDGSSIQERAMSKPEQPKGSGPAPKPRYLTAFDPESVRRARENEEAERERLRRMFPDGKPFPVPSRDDDPDL
jgi:hypothetical protein